MLYTRLDFLSYEIRLLNIQEAPYDESVHCTLERTTLLEPGSYHALSYCWGDQRIKKEIIVNDTIVKVGHNLEAGLRELRSRGYLRVWVDNLCINQSDMEERGLQVRNMRQIYSQAVYVITWLGEDADNIANAVKYLFEKKEYTWSLPRRRTAEYSGISNTRGGKTKEEREWCNQRWRIFQSFFELDYWRRVWVIQEIASSSRVKVLIGRIAMDWQHITNAIDYFKEHPDHIPKACASYKYAAELDHFRIRFKDPRPISLFEAIQWSQYALATEQIDKIYALLGLTYDGSRLVPILSYQRTIEQVLCDLTRALLTAAKSSDPISTEFPDHAQKGWSWSNAKSLQLWSELNTNLGSPCCSFPSMFPHIPVQRTPNVKSLQTQGIFLDQVWQISSPSLHLTDVANKPKVWTDNTRRQNFDVSPRNIDIYPSGIPLAILQTLCLSQVSPIIDPQSCLNNFWRSRGRKEVRDPGILPAWDYINNWLRLNSSLQIGSSMLQEWAQLKSYSKSLKSLLHGSNASIPNREFERCIEVVDKALQSRMCLIITQRGIIGMAPSTAQIGDWICYVKELNIPVILREKEKALNSTAQEYLVIGGAYAHMDERLPGSGGFGAWAENYFMPQSGLQSIVIG